MSGILVQTQLRYVPYLPTLNRTDRLFNRFILREIESEWKSSNLNYRSRIHGLWVELSITELYYLLMSGHKINVYQIDVFVCISVVSTHMTKMTNCEQFRTKSFVEIVVKLRLDTTDIFFVKNVTRML